MSHDSKGDQADHDRVIRSEERLCQIDTQWVAHANVHELEAQALRLQHEEYERRLESLNHENARVAANTATFASREMVDGALAQIKNQLETQQALSGRLLPREVYESTQRDVATKAEVLAATVSGKPSMEQHESLDARVKSLELTQVALGDVARNSERVKQLEDWKNKATGAAVILTLISGAIGAVIAKALGG